MSDYHEFTSKSVSANHFDNYILQLDKQQPITESLCDAKDMVNLVLPYDGTVKSIEKYRDQNTISTLVFNFIHDFILNQSISENFEGPHSYKFLFPNQSSIYIYYTEKNGSNKIKLCDISAKLENRKKPNNKSIINDTNISLIKLSIVGILGTYLCYKIVRSLL